MTPEREKAQSYLNIAIGFSGIWYAWAFTKNGFGVMLNLYSFETKKKQIIPRNKEKYDKIISNKQTIEIQLGKLEWQPIAGNENNIRLLLLHPEAYDILNLDETQLNDLVKWAIEKMKLMITVFSHYLDN